MEKEKMKEKNHRPMNGCPAPGGTSGIYCCASIVTVVRISSTLDIKLSNYVNNNDTLAIEN